MAHFRTSLHSIIFVFFGWANIAFAARREVRAYLSTGSQSSQKDLQVVSEAQNASQFVCPEECQECCQWSKAMSIKTSKTLFKCHLKHMESVEPSYDQEHIFLNGGTHARSRKCTKPEMKHPDLYKTKCEYSMEEKRMDMSKLALPEKCSKAIACCQKDDDLWTEEVCVPREEVSRQANKDINFQRMRKETHQDEWQAAAKEFMESMTIKMNSSVSGKEESYTRHPEQYYENTPGPGKDCRLPGNVHHPYKPKDASVTSPYNNDGCCLSIVELEERYVVREEKFKCKGDDAETCRKKIWDTRKWSECAEFEQVYKCATEEEKAMWLSERTKPKGGREKGGTGGGGEKGAPAAAARDMVFSKILYRRVFAEPSQCMPVESLSSGCPDGYSSSVNCPMDCYEKLSPSKLALYRLTLDY